MKKTIWVPKKYRPLWNELAERGLRPVDIIVGGLVLLHAFIKKEGRPPTEADAQTLEAGESLVLQAIEDNKEALSRTLLNTVVAKRAILDLVSDHLKVVKGVDFGEDPVSKVYIKKY